MGGAIMLCPYRVKTVFEYASINGMLVKSEERSEFEECLPECALYTTYGGCARANKEISDADE